MTAKVTKEFYASTRFGIGETWVNRTEFEITDPQHNHRELRYQIVDLVKNIPDFLRERGLESFTLEFGYKSDRQLGCVVKLSIEDVGRIVDANVDGSWFDLGIKVLTGGKNGKVVQLNMSERAMTVACSSIYDRPDPEADGMSYLYNLFFPHLGDHGPTGKIHQARMEAITEFYDRQKSTAISGLVSHIFVKETNDLAAAIKGYYHPSVIIAVPDPVAG